MMGVANDIIDSLNIEQQSAVIAPQSPVLVLAGAGSGKTRVLVHRIAWLIQQEGVSPHQILAVTFTNKAAREMRERIESLLPFAIQGMWVGTFHGLANRFLRAHYEKAGLPKNFQILDSQDQLQVIKRILVNLQIDPKKWPANQFQWQINQQKEQGKRARHVDAQGDFYQEQLIKVYQSYEQACERGGLVDFSELLLRCHEVLLDNRDLLEHYQARFKHVLIDEFQDTNKIQYAWLRLLTQQHQCLFAVGDDDQSIYGWRGADVANIRGFESDYPTAMMVKLEQNYRSTGNILNAANQLIDNNDDRFGKNLWTESGKGDVISLYSAYNEIDEAKYVVQKIKKEHSKGTNYNEFAILYRSNAQSRLFEEQLLVAGIDYRVYGGLRFFDRKEIKDAMAYLRLVMNRQDDSAFERIVNHPPRGVGAKCLSGIRQQALESNVTLWDAANLICQDESIAARTRGSIKKFISLIEGIAEKVDALSLRECVDTTIQDSGLQVFYAKEKTEKALTRQENLAELVNAAALLEEQEEDDPLSAFLSYAALDSSEDKSDRDEPSVQLMTLHSAKGLEFPIVFITGMEDGLFPHNRTLNDLSELEEERRLCYVGMTRAMQTLYLTYANVRRIYGDVRYTMRSRFLNELPEDCLQEERQEKDSIAPVINYSVSEDNDFPGYCPGQRVSHDLFGDGVIMNIEGDGLQMKVHVNFSSAGEKWLLAERAKLQAL
jgi:DNA helicase II / ATP-dependent DNA helicase PcrA